MLKKTLTWIINFAIASALVIVATASPVSAQETTAGTDGDNGTGSVSEPGKIRIDLRGAGHVQSISGLSVNPASFDVGLLIMGESASKQVTLSHTGGPEAEPIMINEATLIGANPDEFSTSFGGFTTLQPGDTVNVVVTLNPTYPGKKSAALRLTIEGATNPYSLFASGEARYPLTSDLTTPSNPLNLGQVALGGTIVKQLTLENEGQAGAPYINVSDIILGGDNPAAFDMQFSPMTLAPGETKQVNIGFGSNAEGTKTATVEVVHDGNNQNVELMLEGQVVNPNGVPTNFTTKTLAGVTLDKPTSLQFGPDGKLYVAEGDGLIKVLNVTRAGNGNYSGSVAQTISSVKNVKNHDDDGDVNNSLNTRLITGLLVTGTAAAPVIWVASSDPRQGGGGGTPNGGGSQQPNDKNLDTNSGILHKLTKNGGGWLKQDVVRGLPRSEENHVPNGLLMKDGKILLVTGGHTNEGAPSFRFVKIPEYALSAAVLEIDVNAIGGGTYDLPTLDDEDRPGVNDANDPFGGNDGKNQAKLVAGGPVQIYSTGYRNAYDIAMTPNGMLYTVDNGSNSDWGSPPSGCSNNYIAFGGSNFPDNLHLVTKGSYGGHPNPTRGSKNNKFNGSNPQSPIEVSANPEECTFKAPGQDGALTTIGGSTNGLTAYRASNFSGAMYGDLVTAGFGGKKILRINLSTDGTTVLSKDTLVANLPEAPLDVWAQGDGEVFPGTIWSVTYYDDIVTILEPSDY
ncbi:MAG: choice-of-anchor D domain-containing protein [Gammaproteobacteria bacterium]|nr:choice-of-anchor D domain-containing protein [Gammaproteobacteria bacterium]